jgi:hypothetical protein
MAGSGKPAPLMLEIIEMVSSVITEGTKSVAEK